MPTPKITELIDQLDVVELVRNQIAAILVLETANQKALAEAASKDPKLWDLRVYVEREHPWAQFLDLPDDDVAPIVAVSFETDSPDAAGSNAVEKQKTSATFNVDIYGYGVATGTDAGHEPGDYRAALAAYRATRLVRNILMAGQYTYLGLQGIVGRRWYAGRTMFVPEFEAKAAQNIIACRLAFQVDFNEYSPQVVPFDLDALRIEARTMPDGEVLLFEIQIGEEDDDS